MLKEIYAKVVYLANHPHAPFWLFMVAFVESSVFPIPPDVLLIPMVIINRDKAFHYAMLCTAGSVLGGILGYMIGYAGYDFVGQYIVSFYGLEHKFDVLKAWYAEYDIYIVAVAGFSPIPYKVFTIFSGLLQANIFSFIIASLLSRGARFFLIAWLLWRGGPSFKEWIEKNLYPITIAGSIVLILGIVLVKFLLRA